MSGRASLAPDLDRFGNGLVDFYGGIEDGHMVLTGTRHLPSGQSVLVRMEFTPNPDGSVRQHGTASPTMADLAAALRLHLQARVMKPIKPGLL